MLRPLLFILLALLVFATSTAAASDFLKRCTEICENPGYKKAWPDRDKCISACQSYQKEVEACRGASNCMTHGAWPEEDPEETFAKAQKEADSAEHWYFYRLQADVSGYYLSGYGVKQDYTQAMKWCGLAKKNAPPTDRWMDDLLPNCADIEKRLSPEQYKSAEQQIKDWIRTHPDTPKQR